MHGGSVDDMTIAESKSAIRATDIRWHRPQACPPRAHASRSRRPSCTSGCILQSL